MKVSTKGRYAIRALVNIANSKEKIVSLNTIAIEEEISIKYMERIINLLVKAKLIKSIRGVHGGYSLIKSPKEYTLKEILEVSDNGLAPVKCLESKVNTCPHYKECSTVGLWEAIYEERKEFYQNITLQDIIDKKY